MDIYSEIAIKAGENVRVKDVRRERKAVMNSRRRVKPPSPSPGHRRGWQCIGDYGVPSLQLILAHLITPKHMLHWFLSDRRKIRGEKRSPLVDVVECLVQRVAKHP